jgi:hypothetical protein
MNNNIIDILCKVGIKVETIYELDGCIVDRDNLLNEELYNNIKNDINLLKQELSSSSLTSLQKTAINNQKWPLLNLVRQLLNAYNYRMKPIRKAAGYSKGGIKLFKRTFKIEKCKNV